MTKRDRLTLFNLLDTVEEMERFIAQEDCRTLEEFSQNALLRRAVAMCMISISEIIGGFSRDFRKDYPEIRIDQFRSLRNIAAHNYGAINFSRLWDAATIDVPVLYRQLLEIAGA